MNKIRFYILLSIVIGCSKNNNTDNGNYIPSLEIMNKVLIQQMSDFKGEQRIGDEIILNKKYYKSFHPSLDVRFSTKLDSFFQSNTMINRVLIKKNRIIYEFEADAGILTTKFNFIYYDSITPPKIGNGITNVEKLDVYWYYVTTEQSSF